MKNKGLFITILIIALLTFGLFLALEHFTSEEDKKDSNYRVEHKRETILKEENAVDTEEIIDKDFQMPEIDTDSL